MKIDFSRGGNTEFSVASDDFSKLEIRDSGSASGFHYFYDTERSRLITDFVLEELTRVDTLCQVTLIKKGDTFYPHLLFWKRDKSKSGKARQEEVVGDVEGTRAIKARVDTGHCNDSLWKLIHFLQAFSGIALPSNDFRITDATEAQLVESLRGQDKSQILEAVKTVLGGTLTDKDIQLLEDRKKHLDVFKRLLEEPVFFTEEMARLKKKRPEDVWQNFFEENQWIFGYGLTLISSESYDPGKLEKMTTGANVFTGGGKRSDAVMRTRGFVSSLLFAEIKTHLTPLLETTPYRPPDVYQVSKELAGGISQIQKTAHKAVSKLDDLFKQHAPEGDPLFEVSTIQPRKVLIIGSLDQLIGEGGTNVERLSSFELYRRSHSDLEIITFDELYERAKFIVQDA